MIGPNKFLLTMPTSGIKILICDTKIDKNVQLQNQSNAIVLFLSLPSNTVTTSSKFIASLKSFSIDRIDIVKLR